MNRKREKDECLECLWHMKEEGKSSMDELKVRMKGDFDIELVEELFSEGMLKMFEKSTEVKLTDNGEVRARNLIRAHRLAERLMNDVLGGDFESGACEFEHILAPEIIDSICIMLGHPKECPHGLEIPEGECCKRSARTARSSVIPLTELDVGQCGKVAYVNCRDDNRLHKMDGLRIRPGTSVKLHQTFPSYVIECEGVNIALDEAIVADIRVWRDPACQFHPEDTSAVSRKNTFGSFLKKSFHLGKQKERE